MVDRVERDPMARFLRQRVAIVERIEEVLCDEVVAVDEIRRQRPALFGESAAVRVVESEPEVEIGRASCRERV